MADEADISQVRMEIEEEARRKAFKPVEIPKGEGQCLNCDKHLSDDRRWCDTDCREDYQKRNR